MVDRSQDIQKRHLLSLEEQTKLAIEELAVIKKEKADWINTTKERADELASWDKKINIAKSAYGTAIVLHDAEIHSRKEEIGRLENLHSSLHETHAKRAAGNRGAIESQEKTIAENALVIQEQERKIEKSRAEISDSNSRRIEAHTAEELAHRNHRAAVAELDETRKLVSKKKNEHATVFADVERLKRTKHVLVEDTLTDNHKRLFERHQKQTGLSQELDKKIRAQRKSLKN